MFGLIPWKRTAGNGSTALANRLDNGLSLFQDDIDRIFDRFFDHWPRFEPAWTNWGLQMNETEDAVSLKVDAPGFEAEDFNVQVCGDTLHISAERKAENGEEGRYERRFHRAITLPASVAAENVEANYRNGVLELTMPKTEQSKWKKIKVQS